MKKPLQLGALLCGSLMSVACAQLSEADQNSTRQLEGYAPAGSARVLIVDSKGTAFDAIPLADGYFSIGIDSREAVTVFVIEESARVLRFAPTEGGRQTQTVLPDWNGTISTAHMSTCDCNEDGIDEEVAAEENPLAQIDTDNDGVSDLLDADDDNDGILDAEDDDSDGNGALDASEDLDSDDDERPDLCDDDDDNDGRHDEEDEDEAHDWDRDGIDDEYDLDDDNDGRHDDEDDDDHYDDREGRDGEGGHGRDDTSEHEEHEEHEVEHEEHEVEHEEEHHGENEHDDDHGRHSQDDDEDEDEAEEEDHDEDDDDSFGDDGAVTGEDAPADADSAGDDTPPQQG